MWWNGESHVMQELTLVPRLWDLEDPDLCHSDGSNYLSRCSPLVTAPSGTLCLPGFLYWQPAHRWSELK